MHLFGLKTDLTLGEGQRVDKSRKLNVMNADVLALGMQS